MSESPNPDLSVRAGALRALHDARARAELAAADALLPGSDAVGWRGATVASIALVKGRPGPAEAAGGGACSGADGEALLAAVEALGYGAAQAFFTLSRPTGDGAGDSGRRAARLRRQIEAVDPVVTVALDKAAAEDLAVAFDVAAGLSAGQHVHAHGRRIGAVADFEPSLTEERSKIAVWKQLKTVATPDGPVY